MRRCRHFCPNVQSLEERTVLSFSLSSIWHSVLGLVDNNSTTNTAKTPAQIAAEKAAAEATKVAHEAKVAHYQELIAARKAERALNQMAGESK